MFVYLGPEWPDNGFCCISIVLSSMSRRTDWISTLPLSVHHYSFVLIPFFLAMVFIILATVFLSFSCEQDWWCNDCVPSSIPCPHQFIPRIFLICELPPWLRYGMEVCHSWTNWGSIEKKWLNYRRHEKKNLDASDTLIVYDNNTVGVFCMFVYFHCMWIISYMFNHSSFV